MNKHTPTPWALTGKGNLVNVILPNYPNSGGFLGVNLGDMKNYNAEFIVRACNNHDAKTCAKEQRRGAILIVMGLQF